MESSWKDAIKRVLSESNVPLHYQDIAEQAVSHGYYEPNGATPDMTVSSIITTSIKNDGEKSPFLRVGKGIYILKSFSNLPDHQASSAKTKQKRSDVIPEVDEEESAAIIRCFGMYWQRSSVVWRGEPKILGKQNISSKSVDFCKQKGVYILYDHHTVVYVGRVIDRPMGKRFFEHTLDRLGSRWDRFSWFGLLDVTNEGNLEEATLDTSSASVIATIEAVLIEALEPPQNRKRGDNLAGVEYIQDTDPELKEKELQNMLFSIAQKVRG